MTASILLVIASLGPVGVVVAAAIWAYSKGYKTAQAEARAEEAIRALEAIEKAREAGNEAQEEVEAGYSDIATAGNTELFELLRDEDGQGEQNAEAADTA